MRLYITLSAFLVILFSITVDSNALAQSFIKTHGLKINELDKKHRKQGEWIFFDSVGNVKVSCIYRNDKIVSSITFYERGDTSFVLFPKEDGKEMFVLYQKDRPYIGAFVYPTDSTVYIEIDSAINEATVKRIKYYQNFALKPIYQFAQDNINDFLAAKFATSNYSFNKKLVSILDIDANGYVIDVTFPNSSRLSFDEKRELQLIFSSSPRWQPYFAKNKTVASKYIYTINAEIFVNTVPH